MSDAPIAKTLEAFARERGLVTTADVDSHIHAGLRSKPQTRTYQRWYDNELTRLQAARDETMRLYRAEIEAGRLVAPTALDRYAATAAGHPDNPSTQAAKRMLAKLSKSSTERRFRPSRI